MLIFQLLLILRTVAGAPFQKKIENLLSYQKKSEILNNNDHIIDAPHFVTCWNYDNDASYPVFVRCFPLCSGKELEDPANLHQCGVEFPFDSSGLIIQQSGKISEQLAQPYHI